MDAANAPLNDQDEICRMVHERVEAERLQFGEPEPVADQADGGNGNGTDQEPNTTFASSWVLECCHASEDGDAEIFKELNKGKVVFDHAAGKWYYFTGHFFEEDLVEQAFSDVAGVIEIYGQTAEKESWLRLQAEKAGNEDAANKHEKNENFLLKKIRGLQCGGRKVDVLTLARSGRDSLGISGLEWDLDPWLLGCRNGVIDLRDGTHRPGRPEDFIKKPSPTEWKGIDEPAPIFNWFLYEVFAGQAEILTFLQRLLGFCLTGLTTEHIFTIFWGSGRNGKSTLLEILAFVLGPLSGTIPAESILRSSHVKSGGSPSPDIMALRGQRLTYLSESNEARLDAGKLKLLTGGDTLPGRDPYGKRLINFPSFVFKFEV